MFTQKSFLLSLVIGLTLLNGVALVSRKAQQTLEIDNPALELNRDFQGNMSVLPSNEPFVMPADNQYGRRSDLYQDSNQKSFTLPSENYDEWSEGWEKSRS